MSRWIGGLPWPDFAASIRLIRSDMLAALEADDQFDCRAQVRAEMVTAIESVV